MAPIIGTFFLLMALAGPCGAAQGEADGLWARVNVSGALAEVPLPIYAHLRDAEDQEYILTRAAQTALVRSGYSYEVIAGAEPDAPLYLARSRRPAARADIPDSIRILHDDGRNLLIASDTAADLSALSGLGYQLRKISDTPMILAAPKKLLLRAEDRAAITSNAYVAAMIGCVQQTNLYAMVNELSGETPVMAGGVFTNIFTRNTYYTNEVRRALDYAGSRLRALGLDAHYQDWLLYGSVTSRNLIAERTGTTATSEIVIICGHIDSEPYGPLAPGADDNASGTIGVLTAARAMQNYTFDRTIRYVIFTGEEQGLFGSAAYAAAAQTAGDNIVAVYNLDMLSYDSNSDGQCILHTRTTNNPGYAADIELASTFTNAVRLYALETPLIPEIHADGDEYSDHYSFWQNGYPAIFAIEDWIHDETPYYHTTNDRISTLNFPYYTAFVQATVAAAAHSAGPVGELSNAEKVSNAVHAVRVEIETVLGKPVPSLNLFMQTSNETFFASSAASPELAITTGTTFRFASNTKNFTAASVLHMQQQGWLNITDPITNTIPGFSEPYVPTGTNWDIPNKHLITIEQLLRHSAGVYDVDNDNVPGCGGTSYTDYMTTLDPAHQFTVEEMVAQSAFYQLSYFAPDEGYHYSNTGFTMLAEIVGRIYSLHSGSTKKLTDYLYDFIIGGTSPVPIPEIHFPNLATDTALPEPFMGGTERQPSNITIIVSNCNMSAQVGEGNGYGTLPAMNRYIRHTMKGEGVLSRDSIRLMQTDTSPLNAGYALGCTFVQDIGFGHNGCRVGNLSQMNYNPETDVSVAVYLPLVDYSDYPPSFMACFQGIYNAAYRALEALGYPRTPTLAHGSHTNLMLTAGTTNAFYFTAAQGVYYCVKISNTTADVFSRVTPGTDPEDTVTFTNGFGWYCESPGIYRLTVAPAADTPCDLTLLALKLPTPADYSALNWTNAFLAAHEKFSREYAFTTWKSIDWPAMYSNTLPRIVQAQAETNQQAYYAAMHAYVGAIADGHVRLSATNYTVPNAWAAAVAGGGYGLALSELDDGRVIAAAILTNSPAQIAGILPGAEIETWNGLAITSALAQIHVSDYPLKALETTMAIDPQATRDHYRLEQERLLVRGPVGTNAEVRFTNPGGALPETVMLTAQADSNAAFSLLNFAWRQDLAADPVDYEILTNGLGYVVLRIEESLTDPSDITTIYNAFAEAIGTFVTSNVPGVIVDLRGNFGGRDDLAAMLAGFFYTSNAFYEGQEWYNEVDGQFLRITLDETGTLPYLDHLSITPQPVCYRGPVAVLVNPGTISSGEGVTMGIGRLPNARVIGFYGTDGSFGLCGGSIALPGGYTIQYPYGRSLNEQWEIQLDSRDGVGGVHPEIRVPKTEENVLAFAAGQDVELNAAFDYLLNLPELPVGQTVTGTLAAGESLTYRFTTTEPVWHGVYMTPREPALYQPLSDLSVPGVYALALQNPTTSAVPYAVRLYNLTNTIAQVEAYIDSILTDVPAMSIALVDASQLAWADGFGTANREVGIPADANTIYRIASMSKAFASMSVLKLQEGGTLNLADNITNTIPTFSLLPRFTNQSLTVRSLLAHDSNIPGTYYKNAETTVQKTNYYETVLHLLAQDYFVNPPGFYALYNNNGVTLIEGVVAGATGVDYRQYLGEELLTPMGLSNTVFTLSEAQHARLARYYAGSVLRPDEYVNAFASGGLYSSAVDLSRWMRFLLGYGAFDGTTVISSNSMNTIWTPQAPHVALQFAEHLLGFGLGWDQVNDPQFAYASPRACWKNGGAEGYGSFVLVIPEQQLGVVVLNSFSGDSYAQPAARLAMERALEEARGLFAPTNPSVLPTTPVRPMSTNDAADIVGRYATGGGYDLISGDTNGLTWIHGAQSDSPQVHTNLLLHEDGWFYPDGASPAFQLSVTNVQDRAFIRERLILPAGMDTIVFGERFIPNIPDFAWAPRLAKTWIVSDLDPESLYWTSGSDLRMNLTVHDGVLMVSGFSGHATLQPESETLAFPFSINSSDVYALQVWQSNGCEILHYGGLNYRAIEDLPALQRGVTATGLLAAGESALFQLEITDPVYHSLYVAPALDYSLFTVPEWSAVSELSSTGRYVLAVHAASNVNYQVRLNTLTNTIAQTTALITNLMAEHNIPALSIALVDGTNIVWAEGFGTANREAGTPASADTIYRIASCSKTFASASVMQLQDEGLLNIEDDITNTVPAFAMLPRFPDQAITIRELLTHQAQLPGCYFRHADSLVPYDGYYDLSLALLAEDYLIEPRGFLEKYNNNGFTLIEGAVAGANTNGLDYAGYAMARLFEPMGMSNTTFRLTCDQTNLLAKVYWNGVLMPDEYVNTPGSGGAYSTAADLARYARFLLGYGTHDGVTILSSNAVAALWSDQSDHVALVHKEGYAKSGLGWDQIEDTSFAYAGQMAWKDGDSLNYSAIICVMPEYGLAAVALNSIPGADTAAAPAVKLALKMALNEHFGIPLPSTNPPAFPVSPVTTLTEQELAGIVGMYSAEGGYDLVTGTVSAITWLAGADGAAPVRHEGLVPHEDGWFSTTNDPEFRLAFTNIGGRVIMRQHVRYEEYLRILVQAERFTPAPLSAAWSNRVGQAWITGDLEPDSYLWLLGFYPTLQLDIADGVLSVYSSPCQTLQPQNDDLAFPLLSTASQPSALQVKHTNGHEVIRYSGYDFHRVDELPVLQVGLSATGTLAAGASTLYQFTIADPVWHGIYCSPANLVLRQQTTDLSVPGTYSLILQNPGTSEVPFTLRLYTLTNTIAHVSALVSNYLASGSIVGCGLSLVDGTNTIWETGFGYAGKVRGIPADEDTVFMIGSCSKTFGAIAAMQLAEEGRLDLDASITNALPDFTIHQRFADNVITPRTILTHHSGLPGDVFNRGFTVRRNDSASGYIESLLAEDYTLMPTNTCWAYNNSGLVMLGLAIEHLAGTNAAAYAETHLFSRMGMTNSLLRRGDEHPFDQVARPYIAGEVCPDEFCNLDFAGAILSTASDMARYLRMLLAGGMGDHGLVLSNSTFNTMTVQQNADIPLDAYNSSLPMGLGFVLTPPWLEYMGRVIWHDGGTVYFRTLMRAALDAQLGFFISCNNAEASGPNMAIVDSALQWACAEKTGIEPPAPCDPGNPGIAFAPPEVLALATGGVYVTASGYTRFTSDGPSLSAYFNAQTNHTSAQALFYHDNGWFMALGTNAPQYLFTQVVGRTVCVIKHFACGVTNLALLGERSPDIAAFDPAWNVRLGRWWATNMHPDDISWHGDELRLTWPVLDLYTQENMLLLEAEGLYVMSATNDTLAFAAGLGRNKGSALRATGPDALTFMGVTYRSETGIPQLAPGAYTNGTTSGDETHWFRIPAAATPVTFDLATECDLTAYLYTEENDYLGQANRSHAFHLDASNAQPVMAAILRNGTNVGPWKLTIHTNALPFYAQVPPADWPAAFSAHSNVYPNTDFSYVFVPENRTNQTGNLLKIAVARMNASGPGGNSVFFCNGGPGDSSILCTYQYCLRKLTDEYDMYLIDQRGLGLSQPDLALRTNETPSELQYRLTMLENGDLTAVNTLETSLDLDDLSAACGLTNVNMYGQSYGTLITETLMRRDPSWLRAVVLDGVLAPNIPPHSNTGLMRNDALNALFHDVAVHPGASVWYPGFSNTFYTLANYLQAHPVDVDVSGRPMHIDGAEFMNAVFTQMTVSDLGTRERIPNIVYRASAGETAALMELYTGFHANSNMLVNVFGEMVERTIYRHDIIPFDSYEAASNACANLQPLLTANCIDFMKEMFANAELIDPIGQADSTFTNPVTANIPALVINGLYDTQTGTNWAAEVAAHLPSAYLVLAPTVGHGVLLASNGCMEQIIRDFLADPTQAPDTACMTNLVPDFPPPWPTNTGTAVFDETVTNLFTYPHSGMWCRFSAVSGVVYSARQLPSGAQLSVLDGQANLVASGSGGSLSWQSPSSGIQYLWLVAAQTGAVQTALEVPLLFRNMQVDGSQVRLTWQSLTNLVVDLWMTTNLCDAASASCVQSNIPAQGWFTTFDLDDAPTHPVLFHYLRGK